MNDSAVISRATFNLPAEVLAGHLALLDSASLGALMKAKVQDWFSAPGTSSEMASFERVVEGKAIQLRQQSQGELGLRLFGVANEILGIPARQYVATHDFEDNAGEILAECLKFLATANKGFTGSDLQSMIQFTVNAMFGEIGKRFERLSEDRQEDVLRTVRAFLDKLPPEQREEIKRKSGVEGITDDYIRRAIISGSLASVFATAVSIGGFSFYTGAVSLLASLAGIVGITLPFAAYTTLSSTIAVVSSAYFFLPLLAVGGFWLYRDQNHVMRKRILTLVLTQQALAEITDGDGRQPHFDEALTIWSEAWVTVASQRKLLAEAQQAARVADGQVQMIKKQISEEEARASQRQRERHECVARLAEECKNNAQALAEGEWGARSVISGSALWSLQRERQNMAAKPIEGLLGKPIRVAELFGLDRKIESAAQVCAEVNSEAEFAGNSSVPEAVLKLVKRVGAIDDRATASKSTIDDLKQSERVLVADLTRQLALADERMAEKRRAEGAFWGLSALT